MKKAREYHIEIDILRIIAIVAVVVIHTTTKVLAISHYDLGDFSFILFLDQIARFAVPMFFMISGFVLEVSYPHHANYFSYIKKRFNRIFLPYIFWSIIYFFFVFHKHSISSFFLNALPTGGASYQLYFIPSLLIFYAIFPLIHRNYNFFATKRMLFLLAIVQLIFLYIDYYIHPLPLYTTLKVVLLNYFVFLSGIIFSHHRQAIYTIVNSKWQSFLTATIALAIIIFLEGKILYLKTHNYLTFYSQWRPSIMFYSLLLFSLLYTYFINKNITSKTLQTFSRLSFFVFFVHVIVLENVWNNFILPGFISTHNIILKQFVYAPIFIISIVGISFLIAYVVHKIPFLAKITG